MKNALGNTFFWHLLWHTWASPLICFAKRAGPGCPQTYRGFAGFLPACSCSSVVPSSLPAPLLLLFGLALLHRMFAAPQDHRLVPRVTEGRLLDWVCLLPPNSWPSLQYMQNHPVILIEAGMWFCSWLKSTKSKYINLIVGMHMDEVIRMVSIKCPYKTLEKPLMFWHQKIYDTYKAELW